MAEVEVFISTVWLLKLKDGPWIQSELHIFAVLEITKTTELLVVYVEIGYTQSWLAMSGSGGPAIFKTCANAYVRSAFSSRVLIFG